MKFKEFKELEKGIVQQDFNKSYKTINYVMLILSIVGHLTSIFLAYFLVSKILNGVIDNSTIFVGGLTITILSLLELLKRDFFNKFSFQYLITILELKFLFYKIITSK